MNNKRETQRNAKKRKETQRNAKKRNTIWNTVS